MRQKSTVYSPEFHNQFQESKEEINENKKEKLERKLKDKRQGQSDFWVRKETQKRS